MKIYDKNLKAHKTTNVLYLIIIIPFLLLSIFSVVIMINAKNAGGHANIFGYYVIELNNNNFYNPETGEYKAGTKQMFKATSIDNIAEGDIVAWYSDTPPKVVEGDNWTWQELANTLSFTETNFDTTTATSSQVSIVKIGPEKIIFSIDDETYTGFSYYASANGNLIKDTNDIILADDIIGVAVPTNATLASVIDYAKTPESLLLFVLLPCMLLLLVKFISLAFYHKYENANQVSRKGQIVDNEKTAQSKNTYASNTKTGAPQRPTRTSAVRQSPTPRTPPSRPPQRPTRKS